MDHNKFGLSFHHFGLAVKEPTLALKYLSGLGYSCDEAIFDPLQNVNLIMAWHKDMPAVEIIFPGKTTGPLDGMLSKRPEGIVYHLCYESSDVDESISKMEVEDLRVIEVACPKQAVLFGGKQVSFYIVSGVGLIEIIENQN